jgi:hypothetical protein
MNRPTKTVYLDDENKVSIEALSFLTRSDMQANDQARKDAIAAAPENKSEQNVLVTDAMIKRFVQKISTTDKTDAKDILAAVNELPVVQLDKLNKAISEWLNEIDVLLPPKPAAEGAPATQNPT